MRILTVVGARPQFIKSAPVSRALMAANHEELMVHTGQHYDHEMSQIFFDELDLRKPEVNLGVGSGPHGRQTAQMLSQIEEVIGEKEPDCVLVYGDTNSTLAGALAAVKLHVPVAHVEAGLRSYNRSMPEEINRVLTDHCSEFLFCPTNTARENLADEGITQNVFVVGDTMYDATLMFAGIAQQRSTILEELQLEAKKYLLVTVHRPYNTDNPEKLHNILAALEETSETVVFPVHPRTQERLTEMNILVRELPENKIIFLRPVSYLDMLCLEQNARVILTDSGGMQKEAYFFKVPCVTLRTETEWVETVAVGWNVLVGAQKEAILRTLSDHIWPRTERPPLFGSGDASQKIASILGDAILHFRRNGTPAGR